MSKNIKNVLENNEVRFIIYKKGDNWQGIALEFNIVEVHKDPHTTLFNLIEAITGYVETAIKNNIQLSSIKQTPSKKYEDIWKNINQKTPQKESNKIYMFGKKALTNV